MPPQQPPSGLNVIALISGGKDSLYTILHCIRNGHKVVALANLHPPLTTKPSSPSPASSPVIPKDEAEAADAAGTETGEDDIDSFMYQTIGWGVIPLYESALGIPLYRAPITGGAVDTGRVYGDRSTTTAAAAAAAAATPNAPDEDEIESLIPLLKRVMAAHPEANSVCAGAILSTYQRTRIEDVAGRLGLTPLAWLWMYPFLPPPVEREAGGEETEAGLLEDMAAVGCSARIVKVASGALDEGFLWVDVSECSGSMGGGLRRRIVKGMKRFVVEDGEDIRGAVLGEGGEYETLAVDGPRFLWRGRIVVERREVRVGEGGVAYLKLAGARVEMKDGEDGDGDNRVEPGAVRRPGLLDGGFRDALEALKDGDEEEVEDKGMDIAKWPAWTLTRPVQSVNGGLWTVSDIMAPEAGPGAAEQMAAIAKKIQEILNAAAQEAAGRTTGDIIFTTVLLRSMADFPLMNSIYISLFKKPNPPARATVACGDCLPHGVDVVVSMVIDLGARVQRNGLHVQSRSYWAPANIGPYSQAISVPLQGTEKVIYIAGQIPLEPASMELIETSHGCGEPSWSDTYRLRAVLSLQHMWRIGVAMEVCWWLGTVAFFTGKEHTKTRARLAWKLWEKMHESAQEPEEEEESTLDAWDIKYGRRGHEQIKPIMGPRLPDFDLVKTDSLDHVPAFFAVQVHELPRNSDIEWQGLGYRCEGVKMTKRATESGRVIEVTTNQRLMYSCIELDREIPDLKGRLQRLLEAYGPSNTHCIIYSSQPLSRDCFPGQVVPCKSVWGAEGRELAAGVIIQRQT